MMWMERWVGVAVVAAGAILLAGAMNVATAQEVQGYRQLLLCRDMAIQGPARLIQQDRSVTGMAVAMPAGDAGRAQLTARLERRLPAGEYMVYIWGMVPVPERNQPGASVTVSLGRSQARLDLSEPQGRWHRFARQIVTANAPFQELTLSLPPGSPTVHLDHIYLSTEPMDMIFGSAYSGWVYNWPILRATAAGQPLATAQEPDNWFHDGSFEVGLPTHRWSTIYQVGYALRPEYVVEGDAAEGQRSLRLPLRALGHDPSRQTSFRLMHRMLKLQPNTEYHFRGMFRADAAARIDLGVTTAYEKQGVASHRASVGEDWQTVTWSFTTADDPRGHLFYLTATSDNAQAVWVDGLVLSHAPVEAFQPSAPVEVGVSWTPMGRLFHRDQPVKFTLRGRNASEQTSAEAHVRYRVIDYFDQIVAEGTTDGWPIAPGQTQSYPLRLSSETTGAFRLLIDGHIQVNGRRIPLEEQEYAFAVVPEPPAEMAGTLGAYMAVVPDALDVMPRAGIRRITTLSSGNLLLEVWRHIEPERGQFVWWDDHVNQAREAGVHFMANLQVAWKDRHVPEFAQNPAEDDALHAKGRGEGNAFSFSRSAWLSFVETMVTHYKGRIDDWLIIDEPYHYYTAEQYAELLRVTYPVIKRANPEARVLAHGGYYDPWLPALERAGAVPFLDGISDYARTRSQGQRLKDFVARHPDKFVASVEYGGVRGIYQTLEVPNTMADRSSPLLYITNTQEIVGDSPHRGGALASMVWSGAESFGRYDARFPGGDLERLDRHMSLFEYDGSLTPAAVAYAIAAQLIDGMVGIEEVDNDTPLQILHLGDDERFVLAVRTKDGVLRNVHWTPPQDVQMMDIMGNPMQMPLPASRSLIYLIGPNSQLEATLDAVRAAQMRPAVQVATQPMAGRDGRRLQVTVTNQGSHTLRGMVQLEPRELLREFWLPPMQLDPLEPGQSATVTFRLNAPHATLRVPQTGEAHTPRPGRVTLLLNGAESVHRIEDVMPPGS